MNIFGVLPGGDGYILVGCGCWWIVVGGYGLRLMVVSGCGWSLMVVGRGIV